MALLVLAYPRISSADFDLIQEIRAQHDQRYFKIVEPHFTLVFPICEIGLAALSAEVRRRVTGAASITFVCRCAMVVEDDSKSFSHVFLVPDEGFSEIVKLHDQIYAGAIEPELRLDIPYIPHIGVGNDEDARTCRRLANKLNQQQFQLKGVIDTLDIVKYEAGTLETLERIALESR
ncbi:MAG: 2'-5' RNA ligase family protein [Pyrinomonadaceae bacterium]